MGKLEDLYINRMREYLKQKAMDIINKAQAYKETGDITGAQHDSYGALIFYNGGLVYSFIADPQKNLNRQHFFIQTLDDHAGGKHKGWKKGGIPEGTGTDWAKILRNEIKAGAWGDMPKKGFCLIVFNAAFYSVVHEKKYSYRILSMVADDMKNLESQFKKQGAVLRWHNLDIK